MTLEMGFTCRCSGEEQEFRITLHRLRGTLPEARANFLRLYEHQRRMGNKKRKRAERKATARSRALLHRFLTQQQRIELRKLKVVRVRGADGLMYSLSPGGFGHSEVFLLDGEKRVASFCLVHGTRTFLPIFDLMLGQKLLLETDPAKFWVLANVRDLDPPSVPCPPLGEVLRIPQEDSDNPAEGLRQRLEQAA